jgi:hypothetical protein
MSLCSHYGGKYLTETKKTAASYPGNGSSPEVYPLLTCLLRLITLYCISLPSQPPLRVDTKDTAIAESGVTTLDRVAISDRKKGRGYRSNEKRARYTEVFHQGFIWHYLPRTATQKGTICYKMAPRFHGKTPQIIRLLLGIDTPPLQARKSKHHVLVTSIPA